MYNMLDEHGVRNANLRHLANARESDLVPQGLQGLGCRDLFEVDSKGLM